MMFSDTECHVSPYYKFTLHLPDVSHDFSQIVSEKCGMLHKIFTKQHYVSEITTFKMNLHYLLMLQVYFGAWKSHLS